MKEAKKYNGSLVVLKPFSDNVSERSDVFQPVVLGLHHATSTQVTTLYCSLAAAGLYSAARYFLAYIHFNNYMLSDFLLVAFASFVSCCAFFSNSWLNTRCSKIKITIYFMIPQVLPLTANSPVDAVPDVSLYDGVVAVTGHRGPVALAELAHPPDTKVPLSAFVAVGTRYGSGISFQEHV